MPTSEYLCNCVFQELIILFSFRNNEAISRRTRIGESKLRSKKESYAVTVVRVEITLRSLGSHGMELKQKKKMKGDNYFYMR